MIVPSWIFQPGYAEWAEPETYLPDLTVFAATHTRLSEVLGPDGESLMVPYPKPKVGFDLTPTDKRAADKGQNE